MPPTYTTTATAPSTTFSSRASSIQSTTRRSSAAYLHPEDAYSPPRRQTSLSRHDTVTAKRRGRSSSRRRHKNKTTTPNNGQWKKLLWVKQSYPDNYTDEETFLDHLQRNPRLRPYEFWPLVADSTIIVQHVCSVLIFVCCFAGIYEGRITPQSVVGVASMCTVAGWVFRDWWQSKDAGEGGEEQEGPGLDSGLGLGIDARQGGENTSPVGRTSMEAPSDADSAMPTASIAPSRVHSRAHSRNPSTNSSIGIGTPSIPITPQETTPVAAPWPPPSTSTSILSPRMRERLTTIKSSILIYCSLLGLSPILKSLTLSTSSDSIWALSSWLLILNIFTFDYGAGPRAKFPASLSTNAALMASTVLASRLPSTTHVFSLTLFSIEVFGLFPVFRRHLRSYSWTGHLWLTILLVVAASGGLSMVVSGGGWGMGFVGVILGGMLTCLILGMTSWWLIGLQRYKNEIHGPWDPARPVIRRGWD